ncbi:MAG: hypothetical protein PHT02_10130 [Tissierellia bacterium]|nr:hypothetical protein [Tissierellia bacterium]
MADVKKYDNKEKFKVTAIYTDGLYGNDIDIITNNNQKYQISVDKSIELKEDLIGRNIDLKYTKDNKRYYFEHINYKLG